MGDAVSSTVSPLLPLHTSPIHTSSSTARHDSSDTAVTVNSSPLNQMDTEGFYEHVFTIDLPEGKCVGLQLPSTPLPLNNPTSLNPDIIQGNENHWIRKFLHPDEVQFGIEMPSDSARNTFFIGRLAMRTALNLVASTSDAKYYHKDQCPTCNVQCTKYNVHQYSTSR